MLTTLEAEAVSVVDPKQRKKLTFSSGDATYSQTAFKDQLGIEIEQLSDFEPKGAACAAFGVLHPGGFPQRALVLVGPDGVVRWSFQAPSPSDLPGANLIFDALDAP